MRTVLAGAGLALLAGFGAAQAAGKATDGKGVYASICQACHAAGMGVPGIAPPIVSPVVVNAAARQKDYLVQVVLKGLNGTIPLADGTTMTGAMPPLAQLSDAAIAAALNHVLSLNKKPAAIKPADVTAARAQPASNEDLKKRRLELMK